MDIIGGTFLIVDLVIRILFIVLLIYWIVTMRRGKRIVEDAMVDLAGRFADFVAGFSGLYNRHTHSLVEEDTWLPKDTSSPPGQKVTVDVLRGKHDEKKAEQPGTLATRNEE